MCLLLPALSLAQGQKTIHVFVALADNQHQGIVPVPKMLGNGDDARNNLYWGALYGVRTFLRKSASWTLVSSTNNPLPNVLERCVFRHKKQNAELVAHAYKGSQIKSAVKDFLLAASGDRTANADLVAYVGHNGLMDFTVDQKSIKAGRKGRDAIILACRSKPYFDPWLARFKCRSVLLTTGLMAPEAYTLEAALEVWLTGKPGTDIREKAAAAYHQYQKCGMKGARRLFYSDK